MVTYFSVEWKSTRIQKQSSSILIIDARKKCITYAELTMRGDILNQQDGPLQAGSSAQFFSYLTEIFEQWNGQLNFSEPTSEDFWWKIKIRIKSGKTYRIKGTVAYPPYGNVIENKLQNLCAEAGLRIAQTK